MQAVHPGFQPIQIRPVRLSPAVYRRRRLAVLLVAAAIAFGAWLGIHQRTGVSGGGPLTVAGQPVRAVDAQLAARVTAIVRPGDTLWTLARRAQPTGDVRPLVQAMEAQRHGRALQVGERIIVSLGK